MKAARDLDGNGTIEKIELCPGSDPCLTVRHGATVVWQGIPQKWRPWKLRLADVDGDGKHEVILGVHKSTRFFPEPHNCLFVFGWDGEAVCPKWLGSSLSKPFTDFEFLSRPTKGALLVSIEITRDDRRCLVAYEWDQFGFAGDWRSDPFGVLAFRQVPDGMPHVVADGACLTLTVHGRQCDLARCGKHKSEEQVSPSTER